MQILTQGRKNKICCVTDCQGTFTYTLTYQLAIYLAQQFNVLYPNLNQKKSFSLKMFNLLLFQLLFPILINKCLTAPNSLSNSEWRQSLLHWARLENLPEALDSHLSYVAICAVAKDEHADIREWIQYHLFIGIGKIYLYDNGSKPPMINLILDFIDAGKVDYFYFTSTYQADDFLQTKEQKDKKRGIWYKNSGQVWSYSSCLKWFGHRHQFVALFDIDEFLILKQENRNNLNYESVGYDTVVENNIGEGISQRKVLQEPQISNNLNDQNNQLISKYAHQLHNYLKNFENYGGINVYRRFFGSSGHIRRPNKTVMESYTACSSDHNQLQAQKNAKQIVNMDYYHDRCLVHACFLSKPPVNTLQIEETGINRAQGLYEPTWEGLMINHYVIKSLEDFRLKQERGGGHKPNGGKESDYSRRDEYFNEIDIEMTTQCLDAVPLGKLCCSNLTQP
eukprot:TRINITY_DN24517_c0_g1_i4.p1 TRINITY_DN24517_c0_g1~~TRINITY_DN24517_c0_g1_i4.p1  ORF type:complete len:451 (+),score=31.53 TRINITY_DN24517_c0_g1_i4:133-1485(+)